MLRARAKAMPTFLFWYAVFLVGSAVGATVGSSLGDGYAVLAGLLGGMAVSGWIAEQLLLSRPSAPSSEKPLVQPSPSVQPSQSAAAPQGLERVRFASASGSPGLEGSEMKAAEHGTFGGAFSLPKGMYEFAMRKQIEKQAHPPPVAASASRGKAEVCK
jgi:hypothetical protein